MIVITESVIQNKTTIALYALYPRLIDEIYGVKLVIIFV